MDKHLIQAIASKHLGGIPLAINRMTIGICNEVYELKYEAESFILRMNTQKNLLYGTHKFLPLFKQLGIKTPDLLAEDYSQTDFPFCYQIQNKLPGKDLGVVMNGLSQPELTGIAQEVSAILDKFNSLPYSEDFGMLRGESEERRGSMWEIMQQKHQGLEQHGNPQVIDKEMLGIHAQLLADFKPYFLQVKPRLYYDDISSKNVMIHEGKFSGLVDLDFLIKGDYLETIGTMIASWYGEEVGGFYLQEIIRFKQLDPFQQKVGRMYGLVHLMGWLSESGRVFNGNSTGEINWERVEKGKERIRTLYATLNAQ